MEYERELQIAVEAVREASVLCRSVQGAINEEVLAKKDRSPVTVADFGSQSLICRRIHDAFAKDPIIAEEDSAELRSDKSGGLLDRVVTEVRALVPGCGAETVCEWIDFGNSNQYSDRFWTLDPIDGTKGFLRGEQYAISLALVVEGVVTVAVLGCPNLPRVPTESSTVGALFHAMKDQGSFISDLVAGSNSDRIGVSQTAGGNEARFCESVESGHSSHGDAELVAKELGIQKPSVRLDSQAKYAVVGRGEADIYMRLPTRPGYREKIWDHAAGSLVIMEAGGRVTDAMGKPLEFHHGIELGANRGILASNGVLHDQLVAAVQKRVSFTVS